MTTSKKLKSYRLALENWKRSQWRSVSETEPTTQQFNITNPVDKIYADKIREDVFKPQEP